MNKNVLVAGDSLIFRTRVPDYPPSAGYTLKYRLVPRVSGTAITLTAAAVGDEYEVNVTPATTTTWAPGKYGWSSWVEKTGERHTLEYGDLEIRANPQTVSAPVDNRSHARKVLDAIEAVLENRATVDQQSYAINGRQLTRMPISELLRLRNVYASEVRAEEAAARAAAGLGAGGRVLVRF